jgi:hypothetical protein
LGVSGLDEKDPDKGSIFVGCGIALLCQIFLGVLGFFAIATIHKAGMNWAVFALSSWGMTQWIGIVPLIFVMRRDGRKGTAKGLLLMGCIGLLLSSACASVFWGGRIGG